MQFVATNTTNTGRSLTTLHLIRPPLPSQTQTSSGGMELHLQPSPDAPARLNWQTDERTPRRNKDTRRQQTIVPNGGKRRGETREKVSQSEPNADGRTDGSQTIGQTSRG
ncbi:DSBA oxidoreductase [Anopheles sinensis]|uniref:DSBA oxidoreductase n=1 Tax=Anopheles sinensis TaxID=74873 RepID=A0A084W274_ANOSI|nr:DSBA oxidoreductase [Anopheles sinensis]